MTPTTSGSNYSIQSNGSGPGHSSHKSKRQECHPRGEAQMEDARTSTRTFDTIIESPEADTTDIPVFRPEPFPTSKNRNIPVSIQELVYGSKSAGVGTSATSLDRHNKLISLNGGGQGPRKDRGPSEGSDTHVLQRKSPTNRRLIAKPKHFFRGPEAEGGPKGRPKDQWKLHKPPQPRIRPKKCQEKGKKTPKSNQKGNQKAKPKWNKPYPQNYRIPKKEKTAMDNVFNMARTLMEFKNKEEKRMNQSFPKKQTL
ncbi:hypothetical protein O181_133161 [Austropuccinia psidii MF-1]|uniref:Uncharacterized protein n=1 Tax=Austropuccinia psidii MF-1 TaxID=1389203 RepID=A0A9Q3L748_9BASI|nr:hypothetical protein [Austropuccinia psidii MF-1]